MSGELPSHFEVVSRSNPCRTNSVSTDERRFIQGLTQARAANQFGQSFSFCTGVLTTFVDFGFHFNALLVVWFLLPVDWWFGLEFGNQERGNQD